MCGCLSHAPYRGPGPQPNPGMCPDWELNHQPFGSQAGTQSTEPHQPGQIFCIFDIMGYDYTSVLLRGTPEEMTFSLRKTTQMAICMSYFHLYNYPDTGTQTFYANHLLLNLQRTIIFISNNNLFHNILSMIV